MKRTFAIIIAIATALAACSSDEPDTLKLLAYESFPTDPDGPVGLALAEFTEATGVEV